MDPTSLAAWRAFDAVAKPALALTNSGEVTREFGGSNIHGALTCGRTAVPQTMQAPKICCRTRNL